MDLDDLDEAVVTFLTERHLATLTTRRPDGSPHVAPVGFTYDAEARLARVITWADAFKVRNVRENPGQRVAVCQVDGGRWLTVEGTATVATSPQACDEGTSRYAERYREPKQRDDRVVIEIAVTRMMGRA